MHAYILISHDEVSRLQYRTKLLTEWGVGAFDTLILQDPLLPSVGIDAVKSFIRELSLKPKVSPYQVGVIVDSQLLTVEAQNALLKTLEEPPPRSKIILETPSETTLLPTIISRCISIHITSNSLQSDTSNADEAKRLKAGGVAEKIKLIETIAPSKQEALMWIDMAISQLHVSEIQANASLVRACMLARTYVAANVNPRLSLERAFL